MLNHLSQGRAFHVPAITVLMVHRILGPHLKAELCPNHLPSWQGPDSFPKGSLLQ